MPGRAAAAPPGAGDACQSTAEGALRAYLAARNAGLTELLIPLRELMVLCVYVEVGHRDRGAFDIRPALARGR